MSLMSRLPLLLRIKASAAAQDEAGDHNRRSALLGEAVPSRMPSKRTLRRSPRLLLLGALQILGSSCSMMLADTIPTRTGHALASGASRQELVARLGQPDRSMSVSPVASTAFPGLPPNALTNGAACVYDEYHVSGLVQVAGDPYYAEWNVYPAVVLYTLGLAEVINFPYVTFDLMVRSRERYDLRVWYDCGDALIAYARTKRSKNR